jgi:hypothetical protein
VGWWGSGVFPTAKSGIRALDRTTTVRFMGPFRWKTVASCAAFLLLCAGCSSGDPDETVVRPSSGVSSIPVSIVTEVEATLSLGSTLPVVNLPAPDGSTTAAGDTTTGSTAAGGLSGPGCTADPDPVGPQGEVTFVRDGQVWASSAEGLADRCFYNLQGRTIESLRWNPNGDAVLLGSDQIARGAVVAKSGYLPTNRDVNWSAPNGSSLLATTSSGGLVKRNSSSGTRTDVSFLDEHRRSTYHPAGKAIASIGTGTGPEGETRLGIWIADNAGSNSRLVVSDDSGAELGDLAFSSSGDLLFFTAKHETESHLHTYDSDGLMISFDSKEPIGMLTVSTSEEAVAVSVGDCSGSVQTWFGTKADEFRSIAEFGISGSVTPVGWLPGRRLAVLVRPSGCAGPGELRVVHTAEATSWVVANEVSIAAVRSPRAIPNELSESIGSQVVA